MFSSSKRTYWIVVDIALLLLCKGGESIWMTGLWDMLKVQVSYFDSHKHVLRAKQWKTHWTYIVSCPSQFGFLYVLMCVVLDIKSYSFSFDMCSLCVFYLLFFVWLFVKMGQVVTSLLHALECVLTFFWTIMCVYFVHFVFYFFNFELLVSISSFVILFFYRRMRLVV